MIHDDLRGIEGGISTQTVASGGDAATATLHEVAGHDSWPWLPTKRGGPTMPHPYCRKCGLVKFVGSDRAMDVGALMNLMGRFERLLAQWGQRVTEAQRRLIARQLAALDVSDPFGLSRAAQMHVLADVLGEHLRIPAPIVETYLRSC